MARILSNIALFISVIYMPWWLSLGLFIIFCYAFSYYYEGLVAAALSDVLYGREIFWNNFFYASLLSAIVIFCLIEYSKTKLKFYS